MEVKVVDIDELDFGFPIDDTRALPDTTDYSNNSVIQQKATARRREKVFELREEGYKYREIAAKIREMYKYDPNYNFQNLPDGYDDNFVGSDIAAEVNRHIESKKSTVREHVILEVTRIEEMIKSLWDRATEGKAELKAIDRIIKLHKRKADLMGLDAPEQIDVLKREMKEGKAGFEYPSPDEVDNYKQIAAKLQEAEEQLEEEENESKQIEVKGERDG